MKRFDETRVLREIVTVSEMARMCGLSRSRFYQLINEGFFPSPKRNVETKRPYYNREQQEACLQVRRTSLGINGKAVMFYSTQPRSVSAKKPARGHRPARKPIPSVDPVITTLKQSLTELGLNDVSNLAVRQALTDSFPDGHDEVELADLVSSVFRRIKRQNSNDNLAR